MRREKIVDTSNNYAIVCGKLLHCDGTCSFLEASKWVFFGGTGIVSTRSSFFDGAYHWRSGVVALAIHSFFLSFLSSPRFSHCALSKITEVKWTINFFLCQS